MGAIFKLLAICLIVFVASYLVIFIDGSEQLLSLWGPAQIFLYRFFELSEHSPGRQPEINTPISFQQAYYDEILPNISITVSGTDLETAGLGCSICKKVAQYVHDGLQKNITGAAMMTIATPICVGFEKLRVCKELIPKFTPWVITVLANSVFLPDNMCAKAHFCPPVDNPDTPESVPLPDKSTSQQNIPRQNVLPNAKHLTKEDDDDRLWVVHLSDWHYDPEYTEGYDSECGEPVCCRPPNKFDHKAKHPAGKWGDYRCDVPKILIENLLESLPSVVPKIDYIFSTGDLPPHDVWAETPSSIKETTTDTFSVWKRFLAKAPFFPVIGNHEAAPVNSFPTSSMSLASISWLYNILADQWGIWLNEDVEKSIRETGFYSVRLPKDNLRLIGLNTNFWYKLNWWMIIKPLEEWDPEWQLTKVVAELTNAEALGEKVWILGHMSPSDLDAFPIYSIYWSQIVSRFNNTIAGQFFGHAHWDEYNLMYDGSYYETEDGKQRVPPVTGVAYVAPSVTTFKNMNPAFRLYEINKKTKEIMNHYTYYLDVEEANRLDKPTWKVLYDAKTAYSMADLSPQSWHDLSERFLSDHNLYDKFREHASRMHSNKQYPFCHFYENAEECRKRLVCKIRASTSKNGGPYSQHPLCKSQKWLPGLPDDWRMSVPDEISINVDVDKFMKSGSAEMKLNSIEEIKLLEIGITDDGDDDGVKLTNLPYFIVKMILRLIEGGDEAVCR